MQLSIAASNLMSIKVPPSNAAGCDQPILLLIDFGGKGSIHVGIDYRGINVQPPKGFDMKSVLDGEDQWIEIRPESEKET